MTSIARLTTVMEIMRNICAVWNNFKILITLCKNVEFYEYSSFITISNAIINQDFSNISRKLMVFCIAYWGMKITWEARKYINNNVM